MNLSEHIENKELFSETSVKENIYLFCYGSNSIDQIKQRLNIVDNIEYFPSHINNYCRIFGGFSKKWNGGVSSIYPSLSKKVYGITVRLTIKQLEELDNFENGYSKKMIQVYFENDKKYYDTYVYIKDNIIFKSFPSNTYLEAINSMLNDRYPKSLKNTNRKIIIRIIKNKDLMNLSKDSEDKELFSVGVIKQNILILGNWTKEKYIKHINK